VLGVQIRVHVCSGGIGAAAVVDKSGVRSVRQCKDDQKWQLVTICMCLLKILNLISFAHLQFVCSALIAISDL